MGVIDYANDLGILPTHNFCDTHWDRANKINADVMMSQGFKIGDTGCFACPMCCGKINLVKERKYAGTVTEGPEYESAAMLGSNVGIDDFSAVLRANPLCDDLGLDTIPTGNLMAALIEGDEKDLLMIEDLDGKPVDWGDDERIMGIIHQIAQGEGVGATRSDDYSPDRTFVPIHKGPLAGKACDRDQYEAMRSLYYEKRNWTPEGVPLPAC